MFTAHKKIHDPDVTGWGARASIDGKSRGLPLWQLMCQFIGDAVGGWKSLALWKSNPFSEVLACSVERSQFLTAGSANAQKLILRRLSGRHTGRLLPFSLQKTRRVKGIFRVGSIGGI
jgi:hypothetical protein